MSDNTGRIPLTEVEEFKKVDIAQFAINNYGYKKDKIGSTNTGITRLTRESGEWMVVNKNPKTGDYMYYTQNTNSRQIIYQLIQEEEGLKFRDAHKKYYNHSALNMKATKAEQAKPEISEVIRKEKLRTEPLTDTRYLESRGIEKSTLNNPQFRNRVLNKEIILNSGAKFKNTVYPLYTLNEDGDFKKQHVGLEAENFNFKGSVEGSQKSGSVWISNIPDPKKPVDEIVVVESPRDALHKWQLKDKYEPANRIYVATAGPVTAENSKVINRILQHSPNAKVVSALDNDRVGERYDISLINSVSKANLQNAEKRITEQQINIRPYFNSNAGRYNAGINIEIAKGYNEAGKSLKQIDKAIQDIGMTESKGYKFELEEGKGITTVKVRHANQGVHWKGSRELAIKLTGVAIKQDKSYLKDWGEDGEVSKGILNRLDINANKSKLSALAQGTANSSINVTDSLKSLIQTKLSPKKKQLDIGQGIEI